MLKKLIKNYKSNVCMFYLLETLVPVALVRNYNAYFTWRSYRGVCYNPLASFTPATTEPVKLLLFIVNIFRELEFIY